MRVPERVEAMRRAASHRNSIAGRVVVKHADTEGGWMILLALLIAGVVWAVTGDIVWGLSVCFVLGLLIFMVLGRSDGTVESNADEPHGSQELPGRRRSVPGISHRKRGVREKH